MYKNLEFKAGKVLVSIVCLMFKWYITENFSLKILKIVVLIYGFLPPLHEPKLDIESVTMNHALNLKQADVEQDQCFYSLLI